MKKILTFSFLFLGIGWIPILLQSCIGACEKSNKDITYAPTISFSVIEDKYSDSLDRSSKILSLDKIAKYDSLFFKFKVNAQKISYNHNLNVISSLNACEIVEPDFDITKIEIFSDKKWSENLQAGEDLSAIVNFKHFSMKEVKNVNQFVNELQGEGGGFLFFSTPPSENLTHNLKFVFHFKNNSDVIYNADNITINK